MAKVLKTTGLSPSRKTTGKASAEPQGKSRGKSSKSEKTSKKANRTHSIALTPEVLEQDPNEDNADENNDSNPDHDEELSEEARPDSLPETSDTFISAISPSDPLRRYLDEISRYALLEPEQELELVSRMREKGDMQAARRLVTANLRLVVKIAMEYRSIYANLMDLIQEGNIGLMKAVSKFDPTKGARLSYYSSWWIRSYILKYLLDNFRLVKIGTTQAQKKLFYHLMREKQKIEAQGIFAGPKLLAERLNVREKDVEEMQLRLSGRGAEVSLDAPVQSSSEDEGRTTSHQDLMSDPTEGVDTRLEREELIQLLKGKLGEFQKQLNEKELRILKERLLQEDPKTLQEVADRYGLTRERARQIEAKVIDKLRVFLKTWVRGTPDQPPAPRPAPSDFDDPFDDSFDDSGEDPDEGP